MAPPRSYTRAGDDEVSASFTGRCPRRWPLIRPLHSTTTVRHDGRGVTRSLPPPRLTPKSTPGGMPTTTVPLEILARGVHKAFGEHEVLRGIDLEIGRG